MYDYALCVNRIPVGVLGASGYAGRELCGLIARHPGFTLAFATANEQRGERVRVSTSDITFMASDDAPLGDATIVFSALPHGASAEWVARARDAGSKVIDLSSDLRPGNGGALWAAYGMPELGEAARRAIRSADIVANPGCYPTSILLAVAPLVAAGLVPDDATIVANAASGVTGAGNSPKRDLLFAEVADDFRAYGVGNAHRHVAEMRATIDALGSKADILFTPHLLPVARGILTTLTIPLAETVADPLQPYREAYGSEPFVEVTRDQPTLRDVVRRNVVRISAVMATGTRRPTVIVTSALDNLVKGAAGQAVQNANLMSGFDECVGLPS